MVAGHPILDMSKELFRWKVEAYPALIYAGAYGCIRVGPKDFAAGWPKAEIIFDRMHCYWWSNWTDIESNGKILIKSFWQGTDFKKSFLQEYNKRVKKLLSCCQKIDNQEKSDDFFDLWNEFFKVYADFWAAGVVPEVMAYASSRKLEKEISGSDKDQNLSILTQFPEKSFLLEEEYSLMQMAMQACKSKKPFDEAIKEKKMSSSLERHTKAFRDRKSVV